MIICPLCGSDKHETKETLGIYTLYSCVACGLDFWRPIPPALKDFYEAGTKLNSTKEKELEWNHRHFLEKKRDFRTLMDVGCGVGEFLNAVHLAYPSATVYGVELSEGNVEQAKRHYGLNVEAKLLETVLGTFDIITSFEVIEHIPEPGQFLLDAKKRLAPGGLLVLSFPNYARFGDKGEMWDYPPNHLSRFPEPAITRWLSVNGFQIITIEQEPFSSMYFIQKFSRGKIMAFLRRLRGVALEPGTVVRLKEDVTQAEAVRGMKDAVLRIIFFLPALVMRLLGYKYGCLYIEARKIS